MKRIHSPQELGALIRAARKRAGLTLVQCAGATGVGVRFLSELERGKETAELGRAMRIAAAVGLHLYVTDEDP